MTNEPDPPGGRQVVTAAPDQAAAAASRHPQRSKRGCRSGRQVQRHILAMHQDPLEAEELTQDTYVRALERRAQLDPQAALAWLYRIATTVTLDRLRRRRPSIVPLPDEEAAAAAERQPALAARVGARALGDVGVRAAPSRRAARRLPDRDPAPRRARPQQPRDRPTPRLLAGHRQDQSAPRAHLGSARRSPRPARSTSTSAACSSATHSRKAER